MSSKLKPNLKFNGKQHHTSKQHGPLAIHERGAEVAFNTTIRSTKTIGKINRNKQENSGKVTF